MRVFRILSRNIRDAFKSVFRNFSLSLASISCITITLLVVAVAIVLSYNVNNFTKNIEKDVTIVAFLDVDITLNRIDEIKEEIETLDNIDTYQFQSKDEIKEEMMESSEVYKNIMQDYTRENSPLQDTYLIKVEDINLIGETAKEIENISNVSLVKYGEGMVEELVSIFDMVKNITAILVLALILVTAFLITNTIKITIFSRKREIEIMRLVGASNINIKIPFIFEGLIIGILGSVIPILVTIYGYVALYDRFDGYLFTPLISLVVANPFVYITALILLAIAILVGTIGSLNAVKRYLKI